MKKIIDAFKNFVCISDPPKGDVWKASDENLRYGADMVKCIRKHFHDYFTICVAGNNNLKIFKKQFFKKLVQYQSILI